LYFGDEETPPPWTASLAMWINLKGARLML